MVDETEFDIMDADHEERLNDSDDEPYCFDCGEEYELAYLATYANGDYWECKVCGNRFMWAK